MLNIPLVRTSEQIIRIRWRLCPSHLTPIIDLAFPVTADYKWQQGDVWTPVTPSIRGSPSPSSQDVNSVSTHSQPSSSLSHPSSQQSCSSQLRGSNSKGGSSGGSSNSMTARSTFSTAASDSPASNYRHSATLSTFERRAFDKSQGDTLITWGHGEQEFWRDNREITTIYGNVK